MERGFARVESVLAQAQGTWFTGAVARIEFRGAAVFERAYGVTRADRYARPVFRDTPFDLASLTKIFVSTLALGAVDAGLLELDAPLTHLVPEWRGRAHERLTLRMLLAHTSGMHSGADYRDLFDRNVVEFALARDLAAQPGEKVIYSDLGFVALGEILQRARGGSLPAQMHALSPGVQYHPPRSLRASIPATEEDDWRGRVQGVVHDEKAYLMGGVAGHAGLFGTAQDVAWLAEQYLKPLRGDAGVLPGALADEAISQQADDAILRRGLGWALKTRDDNSCGRWFSRETFGHTGFVGTCVWADPVRDCSGVLLTNSVYFGRNDSRDLRAAFYEALIEDLGLK